MSHRKHRIFNLIVILGLLLIMLPQQSTVAQVTPEDGGQVINEKQMLEEYLQRYDSYPTPIGPEKNDFQDSKGLETLYISGTAFKPVFMSDHDRVTYAGRGCVKLYENDPSFPVYLHAPLLLPQGTKISYIDFHYHDVDASQNFEAQFFRAGWNYAADDMEVIATWEPDYNSGSNYSRKYIDYSVDFGHYTLTVEFPPNANENNFVFCGYAIYYEPKPLFGLGFPAIQN